MTSRTDTDLPPGRPVVLEPLAPGMWLILGGGIVAVLAPLFGFLIGTALGPGDTDELSPLQVGLVVGILIGGVGAAVALLGAFRLFLRSRG